MAVNLSKHFAQFRLLLILQRVKYMLNPTLLHELVECHHMGNGKPATEFEKERIVALQVIIRFRHLQQALGADQILALYKRIVTTPAIAGIKEGDKILQNSVGRRISHTNDIFA